MKNTEPIKTHCGKSCQSCVHQPDLNCPGCMIRDPASLSWSCEIAQCCKSKGHLHCTTCQFCDTCYKLQTREQMAANITRKRLAREAAQSRLNHRAAEMGRWLWFLFWLFIPSLIGSFLSSDAFFSTLPAVYWLGTVLALGCDLAHALILVWLGKVSRHYKISGWCHIGSMAITLLLAVSLFLPALEGFGAHLVPVLALPELVVAIIGIYHYYQGHMDVLSGYDNGLKEKWEQLWKWYLICYGTLVGSLVLFTIPVLGILAFFGGLIGVIVLSILEMIYLYRTANFFRSYGQQTEPPETYHHYAR